MKILFTGDWHLGLTTHSNSKERKSREEELRNAVDFIAEYAITEEIDVVVHCGDIFHTNKPSLDDVAFAISFFKKLEDHDIDTFMIEGNHDILSVEKDVGPLELMGRVLSTDIITDTITTVDVSDRGKEARFIFVPFPCKLEDAEAFKSAACLNIFVAHTSLDGATIGHESTLLAKFCHVEKPVENAILISGHIHKFQAIRPDFKNLCLYPGSIIVNDFGEWSQKKGFVVLDVAKEEWEFVETPHRKFYVIDYGVSFENFIASFSGKLDNCIVRVDIKEDANPEVHNENLKRILEFLKSQRLYDFKIKIESCEKLIVRDASMKKESSPRDLFMRYSEMSKFDSSLSELGIEVLSSVSK